MTRKTEKIILFAIALLMVLFKHFLISNLPIEARYYKTDDTLMAEMAINISENNWLGSYQGALLMKGCFFPVFLSIIKLFGLNYLVFLNFLNTLAVLFFVFQLRGLLKLPIQRFILFIVLLMDPCTCARCSFQRVYRTSITEMQVLFFWGSYYGIYIKSLDIKDHFELRELLLIILAGFTLWAIWNTREECFWILPFMITATFLIAFRYWKAGAEKRCSRSLTCLRAGMLLLPFIMLFSGNQIIISLNENHYGAAVRLELADGNFAQALKSIYSVKNKQNILRVTVTHEKLDRLTALSPALRQIRPELDELLAYYDHSDRRRNDGEVEDGWFIWALKYAAFTNGAADTLPKSQNYWKTVHQEVEEALNDPASGLERQMVMPSALMSPLQEGYLQKLPKAFSDAFKYVFTYKDVYPLSGSSGKSRLSNDRFMESLTNNVAIGEGPDEEIRVSEKLPHLAEAVKWLTRIGDIYRVVNPAAALAALLCFVFMLFRLIIKKQQELIAPVLIICGMFLSFLIITVGVSYSEISSFKAILYYYLASGYPLMLGSVWFVILYMIGLIPGKRDKKNQEAA